MKKYNKLLGSSVDPYKFSMTARGVLRMIIPIAMSLTPFLSVNPQELTGLFDSLNGLLDSIDTLIAAGLGVWSSFEIVVGAARKLSIKFGFYK